MTQAHTQRAHARLAPSAAHRWMHCPGSVRMSEGIADTTSSFAAEGTAAHELCAKCLQEGSDPYAYIGSWVDVAKGEIVDTPVDTDEENRFFEIDDEMCDAVGQYVDHVRSLMEAPKGATLFVDIEQKLDMTHLHPGIFGTGDATVFVNGHLHVCDFKYGKGVAVEADDNPQLLLYAAGAARRYHNQQIERLTMHIVQPRAPHKLGPIRQYDIDLLDLFEFESKLAAAAAETDKDDAPLAAGEWCRFCKAQAVCPAIRQKALATAASEFGEVGEAVELIPPEKLTDEKMGRILSEADMILGYVKAVQEHAHKEACAGRMPSGFKLVAKRAIRKWNDEDAAVRTLKVLGHQGDEIFTEPKLKSPAQLEKLFPGKNKNEREAAMADLVVKQSSGTNLVPSDDPRPAVVVDAGSEFGSIE